MLLKHSTRTAQDAIFAWPAATDAGETKPAGPPLPTPQELAIAALTEANAALQGEIAALKADWKHELAVAEDRARLTAARDHVRADEQRLAALTAALEDMRRTFEHELLAAIGPCARELAAAAIGRFVAVRQADSDWLARLVDRRLAALGRDAVVSLQVAPGDLEGGVAAAVPPGTSLEADPALIPGTARLRLRLGNVLIEPVAGLSLLLDLLRDADADG